jgi:hypothetical protein
MDGVAGIAQRAKKALWDRFAASGSLAEHRNVWLGQPRHSNLVFGDCSSNKIAHVGLDFFCEQSVAVGAGGAKTASKDRTPQVAGLGGVEVVRRWCRLSQRSR